MYNIGSILCGTQDALFRVMVGEFRAQECKIAFFDWLRFDSAVVS